MSSYDERVPLLPFALSAKCLDPWHAACRSGSEGRGDPHRGAGVGHRLHSSLSGKKRKDLNTRMTILLYDDEPR